MFGVKRKGALATVLCALVLGAFGLSRVEAQGTAQVRAVHVAAGAPAVDITINGREIFGDLAPRSASGYDEAPAGRQRLRIVAADQPEQAVLDTDVDLQASAQLTLAVLGRLPSIRAVVLRDDNTPPADGQAKVRFVQGAPDAQPVTVATDQGRGRIGSVAYQDAAGYKSVPAGAYDLQLQAAHSSGTLVTVPNVTLRPGEIVTLFATGTAADNSLATLRVDYGAGATLPLALPRTGIGLTADHPSRAAALPLITTIVVLAGAGLWLRRRGGVRR